MHTHAESHSIFRFFFFFFNDVIVLGKVYPGILTMIFEG